MIESSEGESSRRKDKTSAHTSRDSLSEFLLLS